MSISRILSVIIFLLILSSCSSSYYIKKGDKLYNSGRYYKSCRYYRDGYYKLKTDETKSGLAQRIGDAYEKVNILKSASMWYVKALKNDDKNADIIYKVIEIAHRRGDAKLVEEYLKQYEELTGENPGVLKAYMSNLSNADSRYLVKPFRKINKIYSDFSPAYEVGDTNVVYFTSTRSTVKGKARNGGLFGKKNNKDEVTGLYYSNIYRIEFTDQKKYKDKKGRLKVRQLKQAKWMTPERLNDTVINSPANEGSICFSKDGNTMYFTSSRKMGGVSNGTNIFTASRKGDSWGNVRMLNIAPDSISVGHPAISPDGSRLYFVAEMKRGVGGKDIWYCEKKSGRWGEAINAGRVINTEGDEMYPYFRDNGTFYFSSNGHSGLGGLDIFRLEVIKGEEKIFNLGYPFNSVADDFGIVYKSGLDEGLFASSRGKRGDDNIFSFKYVSCVHKLILKARNHSNGDFISGVEVKLVSNKGEEQKIIIGSQRGMSIDLQENEKYLVVISREGFLKEKFVINTEGLKQNKTFEKMVAMKAVDKPIELSNILYETGRWELKKESEQSLNDLVNVLNDNPGIVIELSSHTDMVGADKDNMILSRKRAQSVVEYLVEKGISKDRLVPKGYGETKSKQVGQTDASKYSFLSKGQILTPKYVKGLGKKQQEICNQLNRRTEFRVLRTGFKAGAHTSK